MPMRNYELCGNNFGECHTPCRDYTNVYSSFLLFFTRGKLFHCYNNTKHQRCSLGGGGDCWCGRPRQQTAGGGKMDEEVNILNGMTGFHALENV